MMRVEARLSRAATGGRAANVLGWVGVALCGLYAAFALASAGGAVIALVRGEHVERALPPLFAFHAVSGAVALVAGALQFRFGPRVMGAPPTGHRLVGRVYVASVLATAAAGVAVTARFDVGIALWGFVLEAVLWAGATTLAYHRARARRYVAHRTWMTRSFALTLFFVTFSFAHPAVELAAWSRPATYGVAVLASMAVNLAAAEAWLRASPERVSRAVGALE